MPVITVLAMPARCKMSQKQKKRSLNYGSISLMIFSIVIHIQRKSVFTVTLFQVIISLQSFATAIEAHLPREVLNCVAICHKNLDHSKIIFPLNLNYYGKPLVK